MAIRRLFIGVVDEPFLDTVNIEEPLELSLAVDSYLSDLALDSIVLLAV